MALDAYLTLTGQTLGLIKGSVTQKGREDSILVLACSHLIEIPIERGGHQTGAAMHEPLVITKGLDKSTPLLYQALVKNESFSSWQLKFWTLASGGTPGSGQEFQNLTIELSHARIASIHLVKPNTKDTVRASFPDYEDVGFTYQTIKWTWNVGGISTLATWGSPA